MAEPVGTGPRCQGKDLHPHQRNSWYRLTIADRADVSRPSHPWSVPWTVPSNNVTV